MGTVLNKRDVEPRDLHQVARITDTMKTVCVGRFLIDIPEAAHIESRGAKVDGFDISGFEETEDAFRKRVADRETQLGATPDRLVGNKNVESIWEVRNGSDGVEPYRYEGISTQVLVHGHGINIDRIFEDRALERVEDRPRLVEQRVASTCFTVPAAPG